MELINKLDQIFKRPILEEDEDDGLIGKVVNGIELTEKGLHLKEDGYWYFPRLLKNPDGSFKGIYWYKKQRAESTAKDPEGRVVEHYVGKSDDSLPFVIPPEFKPHVRRIKEQLQAKGGGSSEESSS